MNDRLSAVLELSSREASCRGSVLCDVREFVPSLAKDLEARVVCEVWEAAAVRSQAARTGHRREVLGVVRKDLVSGCCQVVC